MRMPCVAAIAMTLGSVLFAPLGLFGKDSDNVLDFAKVRHTQISLQSDLYGVFRQGSTVLSFPGESTFYLRSTYNAGAREQDLGFGSLHNPYEGSERVEFQPAGKARRVRSAVIVGSRWAFLDSISRQFLVWNEALKSWQTPADIILDRPKPPRDAGGEPTREEVAALRTKLTKALSREKENPDLIAGITDLPQSWKDRDGSQYLLWLRGGPISLLSLKCDQTSFKICQAQRACFVRGLSAEQSSLITSIALEPRSQRVLLLMGSKQIAYELVGTSCLNLVAKVRFRIPKALAGGQGIFVDAENNLWLALREAEGSTSASLMTWDKGQWPSDHSDQGKDSIRP